MKILVIENCGDCPKIIFKYNQNQDELIGYCSEIKGKKSKIPTDSNFHPNCKLKDYVKGGKNEL